MISPAAPAKSNVVLDVVPPTFNVEFGLVMVSPPPPATQVQTEGLAAVQDKNALLPDG
jgi:hypothetical protein